MKCDVCLREDEPTSVVSSSLGPMSFMSCFLCLTNFAEPTSSFIYIYEDVGEKGEGIAEHVDGLTTYSGGSYITWPEWRDARRTMEKLEPLMTKAPT